MNTNELIDKAKYISKLRSDTQLADVIGISRGRISQLRKGIGGKPRYEVALKLLLLAGEPREKAIEEAAKLCGDEELLDILRGGAGALALFFPVAMIWSILENQLPLILCQITGCGSSAPKALGTTGFSPAST